MRLKLIFYLRRNIDKNGQMIKGMKFEMFYCIFNFLSFSVQDGPSSGIARGKEGTRCQEETSSQEIQTSKKPRG